ncbi:MAG TPA: DHA2 family efflux MFS transporter permease subunit [Kineosporiaceae bacterium]|nr:DHA2 family efflux MFS transporter permease subunit [Kineosporiaceae bacterium]
MQPRGNRRWWALFALVPAVLAVGLDATVLSVALPTLAADLHASTDQLQWFVVAYTLVFAAAMVPAGLLGDRFGRRRLLLAALAVFGLGSLACAYSSSPGQLIAARALLGLGGAALVPVAMAVLPVLFAESERPKAIAAIMAATMLGYPIGPILGGWLLDHYWWGWVFLMNVPVVLLGLVTVAVLLPESRGERRTGIDLAGILSSSAGLAALTYGVIQAGDHGWTDRRALLMLAAGGALLTGFVVVQRRAADPLVDLRLFASAGFSWGTGLATAVSFVLFGVLFVMPQYFQAVLGTGAQGSGLRLLPLVAGLLIGAPLADRLARRIGDARAIGLGLVIIAVTFAVATQTTRGTGTLFTVAWIGVNGIGTGLALPTAMDAALGALATQRAAVGSAVIQALRMVGGSFGAAVLGSVLNAGYHARLDLAGLPAPAAAAVRESVSAGVTVATRLGSPALRTSVVDAFLHGMAAMMWTCAGLAAACALLTLLLMPRRRPAPEEPRPSSATMAA